jgi:hypothetical protein
LSDADIIVLLNLRTKSLLVGDLNTNNPAWSSQVSNLSGKKLLDLIDNDSQISVPQQPTHYTPQETGEMVYTVLHKNV